VREQHGVPLSDLTTMRVGGPASRLVTVETTDELVDAVREVDDADEPLLVLSGGSNLILSDEGFDGTVVHVATSGITPESADYCGGAVVRVAAGEVWDDVVARAVVEGWAGVEALSGIPGRTGATPVQNVGAYGQDVSQTIAQVRTWDRQEQAVRTFTNADCAFTYRHSRFKGHSRYVVLDVLFQFEVADLGRPVAYAALAKGLGVELGTRVPLSDARDAVLEQRRARGMVLDDADPDTWSCGSFFTNPILTRREFDALDERVGQRIGWEGPTAPRFPEPDGRLKTSAAWLIEHAGFARGFGLPAPAALSTKHTLAVTNRGGATTADVLALARQVRDGVRDAFGVTLVNEPVIVGEQL
jgi:UDP-N-acetylmuramate dehydrogenase